MHSSPVRHSPPTPCGAVLPFDLHVLGMPPAFNLSQDQTLRFSLLDPKVNSHEAFTPTSSRSSLNHLGWTLASMDSSSTRKAPTQVTCAHCQRSPSHRANRALPQSLSLRRAAHSTSVSETVNTLQAPCSACWVIRARVVVARVGKHSAAPPGSGSARRMNTVRHRAIDQPGRRPWQVKASQAARYTVHRYRCGTTSCVHLPAWPPCAQR